MEGVFFYYYYHSLLIFGLSMYDPWLIIIDIVQFVSNADFE